MHDKPLFSTKTRRAIARYGYSRCVEVFGWYQKSGNGAATIARDYGWTTQQADAAINAGREIDANRGDF